MFSGFLLPAFIERQRTNIVSCFSHLNIPGSYRNHSTDDTSQNNVLIGLMTFGFGWHNNHHHDPKAVSNHERWWELDVEGWIAKRLTK